MRSRIGNWLRKVRRHGRIKKKTSSPSESASRILQLESLEDRRLLAMITVNTSADNLTYGDDEVTLREALEIVEAGDTSSFNLSSQELQQIETSPNGFGTDDLIKFDPALDGHTITFDRFAGLGQITVSKSVKIDASALSTLTIDANDPTPDDSGTGSRLFFFDDLSNGMSVPSVELVGLTLLGGDEDGPGGAILSEAALTLSEMTIRDNFSQQEGGGVAVSVTSSTLTGPVLTVINSTIAYNETSTSGGGVDVLADLSAVQTEPIVVINYSEFDHNESSGDGAGMFAQVNHASMSVFKSRFTDNDSNSDGGGLCVDLLDDASLTVESSHFERNKALSGGGGGLSINAMNADSTVVSTSFFQLNEATDGGGVHVIVGATNQTPLLSDLVVDDNTATGRGGGIFGRVPEDRRLTVQDSTISLNIAEDGGGVHFEMRDAGAGIHAQALNARATVMRSKLLDNRASNRGGGLSTWQGAGAEVEVVESTISGNDAGLLLANGMSTFDLPDSGGGIYSYQFSGDDGVGGNNPNLTDNGIAKLIVRNSTIDNNEAGRGGGGIAVCTKRQDFTREVQSELHVVNSTISGNTAGYDDNPNTPDIVDPVEGRGGGIRLAVFHVSDQLGNPFFDSEPEGVDTHIVNTTITKNTATIGGGVYSVVPSYGDTPETNDDDAIINTTVQNTIVAGNIDFAGAAENYFGTINATASQHNLFGPDANESNRFFDFNPPNHAPLTFANIGSGSNFIAAGNNPLLQDLADRGGLTKTHRPMSGSQAIDNGDDLLALDTSGIMPVALSTDQRGTPNSRILDGDFNLSSIVDIGSYEVALENWLDVTTTADQLDTIPETGGLSLREAVTIANTATNPVKISVPAGIYTLSRTGREMGNASLNDLDVTGNLTIVGAGAGVTVIDNSGLGSSHHRAFDVASGGAELQIESMTIANSSTYANAGLAVHVGANSSFTMSDSAFVNLVANSPFAALDGAAVLVSGGDVTIRRSVFTNNTTTTGSGGAVAVFGGGVDPPVVTIGQSIFALNQDYNSSPNVYIGTTASLDDQGDNLYDDISGGFFNVTMNATNHEGTPDYVVTTLLDTFDHTDNDYSLSIREAIGLANDNQNGHDEVWLPAWEFKLTLDRESYGGGSSTDTSVEFGDLDISDSLTIRGVRSDLTTVAWEDPTECDVVFDLLGDYTGDGFLSADDGDVGGPDFIAWQQQEGASGGVGVFSADGDDDGDVDSYDLDIWSMHSDNTLDIWDIG